MVRSWKPHFASNRSGPRAARSGPRSEDAQPNESMNRRQRHPPTVNSATYNRRAWWLGRGSNRLPVNHQNVQSVVRAHTRSTRAPSSTSVNGAVPYTRPRSPATTSGTGCPNTAQTPIDTIPRQPRQGHSASTPSIPTSGSPAPKRQKLEGSPGVEVKHEIPTETMASNFVFSVSPVSSETLVGDHKVKVERDISPELYSNPQLNTSGSKRYAPLPPECRKSHPNHAAARSAWARKEQEALRRLGLRVVRTFIREDGMVIDWEAIDSEPTDTAAVIERALFLNDAAIRDPPTLSVERATSASHSSKRRQLDGGNDVPFAVEVAPLVSLEGPAGLAPSVEDRGADASRIRGPSRKSSMDRRGQSQTQSMHMDTGDNASVHTPASIACVSEDLRDTAPPAVSPFSSSPRHPRSPMRHQTINDPLLHPTSPSTSVRMRASSSQSTHLPHGHSISPRPFSSPPPSQHALDTLHHILQLKRQISRSSSSTGPPAVSPSPSCPLRKLYPAPKEQPQSPPKRSVDSSADVVAAALNESARLSQRGSGRASASSTPLRVYKKRELAAVPAVRGNGKNTESRNEPGHRERDSLSHEGHSSPPIAVLGLAGSSPGSPLTELTPSINGDEWDELDLTYPPHPRPSFPDVISHNPLAGVLTEPPRPVESTEPPGEASLLSFKRPLPEENAAMQSAALQYLERYCRTFDTDRRALAEAYASNAAFSCPSCSLRTQGRDGIMNALATLEHGVLCSGNVEYDVSYFIPGIGVLLVVIGTMIGAQGDKDRGVGYTMNFVLQPGDQEDRESGQDTEQWPLVAVMHQIVLREGS